MAARDSFVNERASAGIAIHPAGEVRGMFGALDRLGYDIESLLAGVGFCRSDLDAPIPARVCAGVLAAANRQHRLKNLPLRLAMEIPLGANPLLDYIVASSESVGEGLRRLSQYLRLVNPGIVIELHDQEELIRVQVESPGDPFGVELTVSLSVIRFRGETDNRLKVAGVSFRHEPEEASEFAKCLGAPVRTRSSWNGWMLSRAALQLPMRRRDPALGAWLEGRAAKILSAQAKDESTADQVRNVLGTRMAGGDMRIEVVAQRLATTPRTLQRRLAEEGTTFDAVRDSIRRSAAESFLAESTLTIGEVAYLLGYSEAAAFHRALKRWHGIGPLAFRKKLLSGNPLVP